MDLRLELPPNCDAISFSSLTNATHRKQVMYAGQFRKKTANEDFEFVVTPEVLKQWAQDGNEMLSEGVRCTMPLEHKGMENPEMNRGHIVQWELGYDSKGRDALFAHFQFTDNAQVEVLETSDVSIWCPEEYHHATNGKTYARPIRHVAFTDYPVIPDLDRCEVLALSYQPTKEPGSMSYIALAKKLKIDVADDVTEEDAEVAIVGAFEALQPEPEPEPEPEDDKKPNALAASLITATTKTRAMQLDALVSGGHITPAACTELKKAWTDKDTLTMALSEQGEFKDGFDTLIGALKHNKALVLGEQSGHQVPRGENAAQNPLWADAEKRSKA